MNNENEVAARVRFSSACDGIHNYEFPWPYIANSLLISVWARGIKKKNWNVGSTIEYQLNVFNKQYKDPGPNILE